jgi:group I intron endonuclease
MYIFNSLLKHGYSNFSLTILDYCEPDKCLIREKHYWDLLQPEYNIAKDPTAPFSGRKHADESKQKISDANKGENHPNFGKTGENNPMFGKKHSEETKQIMSEANKGENNPMYGKPKAVGAGKPSQVIEIIDSTNNTTTSYDSISAAARALNIEPSRIKSLTLRLIKV